MEIKRLESGVIHVVISELTQLLSRAVIASTPSNVTLGRSSTGLSVASPGQQSPERLSVLSINEKEIARLEVKQCIPDTALNASAPPIIFPPAAKHGPARR